MKIVILDNGSMGEDLPYESLKRYGELVIYDKTTPTEVIARIADANVIILNKVKITREVLATAKQLKLVCVFATGYDNIDIEAAREYGVGVCNVPGYSTDSVTLITVSTVLALISHLYEYNRFVRSGDYSNSPYPNKIAPVFHEMQGKTWGIIGFGNIGRAVARVAEAFGARVIVNKRTQVADHECVDIETLCRESDIITVHCPLNDSTRGLIDRDKIALMKSGVILVNEARGAVLNEADVTAAVKNGKISGFGCDVYSTEPFPKSHPYYEIKDMDNVLLTPHAAWAAYEARERCLNIIAKNIESYINRSTLNRVDLIK